MAVLNNSPSTAIGGYAPITVMTGREPSSPLDVVFLPHEKIFTAMEVKSQDFKQQVEMFRRAAARRDEEIAALAQRKTAVRRGEHDVDFDIGDYVLVANTSAKKDKTRPHWTGPARVLSQLHNRTFTVEDIVTREQRQVHAQHLKRYADKHLHITQHLRDFAAHTGRGHVIDYIADHRGLDSVDECELLVRWEEYDEEEATWEPLTSMYIDAPAAVRQYIKGVSKRDHKTRLQQLVRLL
jgi:hypothetical protein